jgi:GntR family transcriptional regulator, gluconate operon transcriptional repressor
MDSDGDGLGLGVQGLRPLSAPRPIAEEAAVLIREQILSGGFRQGEHLVEAKIAHQLNVSRGPVREALKLLRAEGLVADEPRRGTFVVSIDTADVSEIYDLRAGVESRAARALALTCPDAGYAPLQALAQRIGEAARTGDVRQISQNDLLFHETICRLSGNGRLLEVFARYVPTLRSLLSLDEYLYKDLSDIPRQHVEILLAIESRNAQQAAALCEMHCDDAGQRVVAYLKSLPDHR